MHRVIVGLGPFRVQSYGLMLALAFLIGGALLLRGARRRSLDEGKIVNLIYVIVFASVVGARSMYVLAHWGDYAGDPLGIVRIWEGGLTLYGGLLLAVAAAVLYMRHAGLPILVVCDLGAPSIALGKVLARIGCFLNGCCFGVESHLPWAVEFPRGCQAGSVFPGTHIHPTQLYSSALSLVILLVLLVLGRRRLKAGFVFWSFLLMDSLLRFMLAFVRYAEPGTIVVARRGLTLDENQLIAIAVAAIAILMMARSRTRS